MPQPTDQPATDQTLTSLIDEAIGARQMLPRRERCEELDRALRDRVAQLLPSVEVRADAAVERTREWYRLRAIVGEARETLDAGLGHGLLSAAIQVGRLAEQCQALAAEAS
ncbi:DUF6415 family natural product biosynthesis protein [Streptomyces sp. NPDC058398]|uniref:DUF6415 family natural product biosynthesis protein n=1 Tax=Streptomyces sp. NPDC058398 TaxID=3346479 RepID=UPI0036518EFF